MKKSARGGVKMALRRAKAKSRKQKYVLVLYVTGSTPLSLRAVQNLRRICDQYLAGHHTIEVVDLYVDPKRAVTADVFAAPTMVKMLPLPIQKFVGDMSDKKSILARLMISD